MSKNVMQIIILFFVLVLAQIVCYKIMLFGLAVPIVFIYLILRLPINWHLNVALTIAFLMGLAVDITCNTPGLNALCCTLLAVFRYPIFSLYVSREDDMNVPTPSVESLGLGSYFRYMSTMVVIYATMLFFLQSIGMHNLPVTLARIGASSVLSIALILGLDSLVSTRREKRL